MNVLKEKRKTRKSTDKSCFILEGLYSYDYLSHTYSGFWVIKTVNLNKKQKEILENSLGQTIKSKKDEQIRFEFDNLLNFS